MPDLSKGEPLDLDDCLLPELDDLDSLPEDWTIGSESGQESAFDDAL